MATSVKSNGVLVVAAEVGDDVAGRGEVLHQRVLQPEAAVVAADGDAHVYSSEVELHAGAASSSSREMAPSRRRRGVSPVRSSTVDSTPIGQGRHR